MAERAATTWRARDCTAGSASRLEGMFEQVIPVLMVREVASAIRFYRDHLGFTLRFEDAPGDPRYAVLARDAVQVHLQWHDRSQWHAGADFPTYRIQVADPDALSASLTAPDLDRTPVRATPWGTREFHLRDPDGNGLQFFRRA